jgi:hypothetical protein
MKNLTIKLKNRHIEKEMTSNKSGIREILLEGLLEI